MEKLIKYLYSVNLYECRKDIKEMEMDFDYEELIPIESINGITIDLNTCNPLLAYNYYKRLSEISDDDVVEVNVSKLALTQEQYLNLLQKKSLDYDDYNPFIINNVTIQKARHYLYSNDSLELIKDILLGDFDFFNMQSICKISNVDYEKYLKCKESKNLKNLSFEEVNRLLDCMLNFNQIDSKLFDLYK